jgi:hypothetical protein
LGDPVECEQRVLANADDAAEVLELPPEPFSQPLDHAGSLRLA